MYEPRAKTSPAHLENEQPMGSGTLAVPNIDRSVAVACAATCASVSVSKISADGPTI